MPDMILDNPAIPTPFLTRLPILSALSISATASIEPNSFTINAKKQNRKAKIVPKSNSGLSIKKESAISFILYETLICPGKLNI